MEELHKGGVFIACI